MSTKAECFEGPDADTELANLQAALTRAGFEQVLKEGILAQELTTDNDSPCWRGDQARGHMVRASRDWLCPKGWLKSDLKNLALVEHVASRIAIAITQGDHNTGRSDHDPRTRPRGEVTIGRVHFNQMSFLEELLGPDEPPRVLWVFLFSIREGRAYSELSLPSAVDEDDRIVGWVKRIILPVIHFGDLNPASRPEDEPLQDVPVHRKSGG